MWTSRDSVIHSEACSPQSKTAPARLLALFMRPLFRELYSCRSQQSCENIATVAKIAKRLGTLSPRQTFKDLSSSLFLVKFYVYFLNLIWFNNDILLPFFFLGSNLILERLMVKKGIPENMEFLSFDSEANLCRATYVRRTLTLLFEKHSLPFQIKKAILS